MEELELTYLVKNIPKGLSESPSKKIVDQYIPLESEHPTLRLRKNGEKMELTKKEPIKDGDASHQLEETIPLTADEYEAIAKIPAKRVSKTRYYYPYQGRTLEVDVFEEDLSGLVLVDVEFDDLSAKEKFAMPEFCLVEVTQDETLAVGMLAGKGFADIEKHLFEVGYNKIIK